MPNLEPTEQISMRNCTERLHCSSTQKASVKAGVTDLGNQGDFTKNSRTILHLLGIFDPHNIPAINSTRNIVLKKQVKTATTDRFLPNSSTNGAEISPTFRGPTMLLGRTIPLSYPDEQPHSHLFFR